MADYNKFPGGFSKEQLDKGLNTPSVSNGLSHLDALIEALRRAANAPNPLDTEGQDVFK